MSFRHTFITEFLYKSNKQDELDAIRKKLEEYGHVEWRGGGMEGLGYFHGIIKDSNGHDTKNEKEKIINEILIKTGVRLEIIIE